ncbi:MAG: hypothetical protein A4E40_01424 [Methanoregulaceae archaeon PtaU1.Bin059]|nr:MAG: hypothetical protein A4E40_01424 [Methanoregulaceae archaeon PtaU1.Bin059]
MGIAMSDAMSVAAREMRRDLAVISSTSGSKLIISSPAWMKPSMISFKSAPRLLSCALTAPDVVTVYSPRNDKSVFLLKRLDFKKWGIYWYTN